MFKLDNLANTSSKLQLHRQAQLNSRQKLVEEESKSTSIIGGSRITDFGIAQDDTDVQTAKEITMHTPVALQK